MLHRLRKWSETAKFRRLFDVCVVGRICIEGCLCRDFSHWQACIGEAVMQPVKYRIFIVQTAVQPLIKQNKSPPASCL